MTAEELAEIIAERTPFCPTIEEAKSILAALLFRQETSVAVTGERVAEVGPGKRDPGDTTQPEASDTSRAPPAAAAVPNTNDVLTGGYIDDRMSVAAVLGERDETQPPPGWRRAMNSDGVTFSEDFVHHPGQGGRNWMTLSDAWALHDKDQRVAARVPPQSEPAEMPEDCPPAGWKDGDPVPNDGVPASEPTSDERWAETRRQVAELSRATSEPTEDRSEPPDGYCVSGIRYFRQWADGLGVTEGREGAVAACWAHRDRITAPLRAHIAVLEKLNRTLEEYDEKALFDCRARLSEMEHEQERLQAVAAHYDDDRKSFLAQRDAASDALTTARADALRLRAEMTDARIEVSAARALLGKPGSPIPFNRERAHASAVEHFGKAEGDRLFPDFASPTPESPTPTAEPREDEP